MKYQCILGVKVGDKVHPPGDVIDLTDEQAAVCLRKLAVVPVPDPAPSQPAAPAASRAPAPAVPSQPAQLVEEAANLVKQAEEEIKDTPGTDAK